MNRFQDRRMVKKWGGGAVSFKQVKFGDDFHPTNWSLGGAQFLFVTEEILYSNMSTVISKHFGTSILMESFA